MAAFLAESVTDLGPVSLALIPAFGALGGYLTGSNTGAAAMFSIGFATRDLVLGTLEVADVAGLALMAVSAVSLGLVLLGGYTPAAMAQAWRAASGRPVRGLPGELD